MDACYVICFKYAEDDEIFLNDVVWILRKKCGIDLNEIFDFLDGFMDLVNIISLDSEDYENMKEFMLRYNLKPSDALHVSSMKKGGIKTIVSEDPDFDKVEWIKRIWIGRGGI